MSYIADQLKRIGLIIDYKNQTPINEYSPYKVKIQFWHTNGHTNHIDITDSELTKIYRILSKGEKLHSNRRRGLRKNETPLERLRHHVSGAIERGEKQAIAGIPATRIPTDYEYRMREAQLFRKDIQDVEKASLADRKEAAMHWLFDLKNNPLMVAERVLWLFQGAYGKGSYDAACAVLKSRMNQVAWAAITIAALEWKCPARFATMAWKKLNPVEQRKVNGLIKMKIEEFKKDGSCG
jgi:hypothetical protein